MFGTMRHNLQADLLPALEILTSCRFKNVSTNPSVQKIYGWSKFESRALCLVQQVCLCHVIQIAVYRQIKKILNSYWLSEIFLTDMNLLTFS